MNKNSHGVWSNTERKWGEVFLTQSLFTAELGLKIKSFLTEENLLFLAEKEFELDIFTEPLDPLTEATVRELCITLGYRILEIKKIQKNGKYLGSDYGYHSSDHYETLSYSCITLVNA
jgi:hypothetical protein